MLFGCTLEPCGFSFAFLTACLYNRKKGEQKDNTAFLPPHVFIHATALFCPPPVQEMVPKQHAAEGPKMFNMD